MRDAGNDDLELVHVTMEIRMNGAEDWVFKPVGVVMHVGRQLHVVWGIVILRPNNIIVDVDRHHMAYEKIGSTSRRRIRKQVFWRTKFLSLLSFCHFSALGADETTRATFFSEEDRLRIASREKKRNGRGGPRDRLRTGCCP